MGLEYLHLVLGEDDRMGLLLVSPPRCQTLSLSELAALVLDVRVESPRLVVLEDFNIYAEARTDKRAQDFLPAMTILGLTQVASSLTHWGDLS